MNQSGLITISEWINRKLFIAGFPLSIMGKEPFPDKPSYDELVSGKADFNIEDWEEPLKYVMARFFINTAKENHEFRHIFLGGASGVELKNYDEDRWSKIENLPVPFYVGNEAEDIARDYLRNMGVAEYLEVTRGEEMAKSYEEMIYRWNTGDVIWEKIIFKNGKVSNTWTLVYNNKEIPVFRLLHSTPVPENSEHTLRNRLYKRASVDAVDTNLQVFLDEALDMIYKRCEPPTPRDEINTSIELINDRTVNEYLRDVMKQVFEEEE